MVAFGAVACGLLAPATASAGTLDQSNTSLRLELSLTGPEAEDIGLPDSWAQTFTAGRSGLLDRIDVPLVNDSAATAPLTVQVTATTASGAPDLSRVLASLSVPASAVPTTGNDWVQVPVAPAVPVAVEAGTLYALVLSAQGSDTYWVATSGRDAYPRGTAFADEEHPPDAASLERMENQDVGFRTFVESGTLVRFTSQGCSVWEVPTGVQSVRAWAVGAAGGNGVVRSGGRGDGFAATLAGLGGDEHLDVCVAVGGGRGGQDAFVGGDGGGASGVSLGATFLHPLLVAAGGGGGSFGAGGAAGHPAGEAGGGAGLDPGGLGATQDAGGAPSSGAAAGAGFDEGGPGAGGAGAMDGGGGGAGLYGGGGGGYLTGGGGGSSFCDDTAMVSGCSRFAGAGTATGAGPGLEDAQVALFYSPEPPSVQVAVPAVGATYRQGQQVRTSFACREGRRGPGIASCRDMAGRASGSALDTATPGTHTFTATATSADDQSTTSAPVRYTVTAPPATPPTTNLPATPPTTNPPAAAPDAPPAVRIRRFRQSQERWRTRSRKASRRVRKRPVGTRFSFRLNRAAKVKVVFTARKRGRKAGGHCVRRTSKNRDARRCRRTVTVGTIRRTGERGLNRIKFAGRVRRGHEPRHRRRLRPGRYTVRVVAKAAGHKATSKRLRFKIVSSR